ncbi:MAG: hypothetical protein LBR23_00320 [Spirochaetaceae bacterium]|jgi:hypothetical protein|nr:hypothetical protein [Spirochaetaceae bacterium]
MAIQPIDLQTLYTQLDKVSKTAVQQQQGAQMARELQQDAVQRETLRRSETVKELPGNERSVGAVDDGGGGRNDGGGKKKQKRDAPTPQGEGDKKYVLVSDASLGSHIDVSG